MKNSLYALSLGIGAMILATQHAFAETRNCAPHEAVQERLGTQYGETRQAVGLGQDDTAVEIWANVTTGTWTITVTTPDGPTCLVAAGEAWETLRGGLPLPGDPA